MHPMTMFLPIVAGQTCLLAVGYIQMPCYALSWVPQACKHAYLSLLLPCLVYFTNSVKLLSFAILPWCFEHVLVVFGSSSVIMLVVLDMYMLAMPFVAMKCYCIMLFWCQLSAMLLFLDSLLSYLVSCVCVEPLLCFEHVLYEICMFLHVDAY